MSPTIAPASLINLVPVSHGSLTEVTTIPELHRFLDADSFLTHEELVMKALG